MADTGEDREIKQRSNANEAEAIRESKRLAATMKERSTKQASRKRVKKKDRSKSRS